MSKVYIEKERVSHILTVNNTGSRIEKNDFVLFGSFCGVADNDSEAGAELSLHIERGIEIQVGSSDLVEQTAAIGAPLYYNAAGKFTTAAVGAGDIDNTLVGTVTANNIASGGVLLFAKN
jgi:predicted RecA/RadA family phage recombinase